MYQYKKHLRILLLGAGNRLSWCEWFLNTCGEMAITPEIFSYEKEKIVPIVKYAKILRGLSFNNNKTESEIIKIIKNRKISICVPFMDSATVLLSKIKKETEKSGCLSIVSDYNICKIFEDKLLAKMWFIKNKVRTPRLYDKRKLNKFPAIAKNYLGFGSRGIFVINDAKDFDYFVKKIDNDDYFIEEFISGEEYTVDSYVGRDKKILNIIPRLRIKVVNGEVSVAKIINDDGIINFSENILARGNFYGPITLQIIKDKKGKLFAIEINPRFGGGVILSFKAGANFIKYILQEYFNKKITKLSWYNNLLMMRANQEVWFNTYEKK